MKLRFILSSIVLCVSNYCWAVSDEQSHPQDVFFMNAYGDEENGYCVVMEDEGGDIQELITTEGALDRKQLREAVRYLTYREHWVIGVALPATAIAVGLGALFTGSASLSVLAGVLGTVEELGTSSYQLIRGHYEEETAHAQLAASAAVGPLSFLAEHLIRGSREKALTDEDRRLTFKDKEKLQSLELLERVKAVHSYGLYLGKKKQNKIIERLQETVPAYENGCDHLF